MREAIAVNGHDPAPSRDESSPKTIQEKRAAVFFARRAARGAPPLPLPRVAPPGHIVSDELADYFYGAGGTRTLRAVKREQRRRYKRQRRAELAAASRTSSNAPPFRRSRDGAGSRP